MPISDSSIPGLGQHGNSRNQGFSLPLFLKVYNNAKTRSFIYKNGTRYTGRNITSLSLPRSLVQKYKENRKSPNLFPVIVGKSPNLFPIIVGKSPNLFPIIVGKSPNLFPKNVGKSPNLCCDTEALTIITLIFWQPIMLLVCSQQPEIPLHSQSSGSRVL